MSHYTDYATGSAHLRTRLGVKRLTPRQAEQVKQAVARHTERASRNTTKPYQPIERLIQTVNRRTLERIAPLFRNAYRHHSHLTLVVKSGKPSIRTDHATQFTKYGPKISGQTTTVTLQSNWKRKIHDAGLDIRAGLLTLSAVPIMTDGQATVYRATWLVQRAGYGTGTQTGYMAVQGTHTYHGLDSAEKSLAGLARLLRRSGESLAGRAMLDRILAWDYAGLESIPIKRKDSLSTGNCETGTDSFIQRWLDGRTDGTVGDLVRLLQRSGFTPKRDDTTVRLANTLARAVKRRWKKVALTV